MTAAFIPIGVATFGLLAFSWAYVSFTRKFVCPLMADSLLNGAVLMGAISVVLFSDSLDLVTAANRAAINILFALVALIVQAQIIVVHRLYHQIVGPEEPQ